MSFILPIIVLIPLLFLVPLAYFDREHAGKVTVACSIIVLALAMLSIFFAKTSGYATVSFSALYISQLGLSFSLALTNITSILLAMTAILFLAVSVVGYYFIREKEKLYGTILLISEMSALGIFLAAAIPTPIIPMSVMLVYAIMRFIFVCLRLTIAEYIAEKANMAAIYGA